MKEELFILMNWSVHYEGRTFYLLRWARALTSTSNWKDFELTLSKLLSHSFETFAQVFLPPKSGGVRRLKRNIRAVINPSNFLIQVGNLSLQLPQRLFIAIPVGRSTSAEAEGGRC